MSSQQSEDHSTLRSNRSRATWFDTTVNLTAQQAREADPVFRGWGSGPLSHLTRLAVPRPAPHGFRLSVSGRRCRDLLSARFSSDSLTGTSGRGTDRDPIVADLVTSGRLEFGRGGRIHSVVPGQICIRDTKYVWEFSCAPATHVRMIAIPRHSLMSRIGPLKGLDHPHLGEVTSPEAAPLMNVLDALDSPSDCPEGSSRARNDALDACATLLSGILAPSPGTGPDGPRTELLRAAENAIERNLDRPDLSPALIADILGVSIRTLHRTFSGSGRSVMSFTRHRRVQRAHDDLMRSDSALCVSEIAARWHFSDASHFIMNFKSVFGATPTAYLKTRRSLEVR